MKGGAAGDKVGSLLLVVVGEVGPIQTASAPVPHQYPVRVVALHGVVVVIVVVVVVVILLLVVVVL